MKTDFTGVRTTGDAKPYKPKSILDPSFFYVNAANTSVAETFKRVRAEMEKAKYERGGK